MKISWGSGIGAAYAIFAISIILFVVKASQQHYDLVNKSYYAEAVNYQQQINARENAAAGNIHLTFSYSHDTLLVKASGNSNPVSGVLSFYKPDQAADDFTVQFTTDSTGSRRLTLNHLSPGWWRIKASWSMEGKDCLQEEKILIK